MQNNPKVCKNESTRQRAAIETSVDEQILLAPGVSSNEEYCGFPVMSTGTTYEDVGRVDCGTSWQTDVCLPMSLRDRLNAEGISPEEAARLTAEELKIFLKFNVRDVLALRDC